MVLVLVVLLTYKGDAEVFQGKLDTRTASYKPKGVGTMVEVAGMCVIFCENGNSGGYAKSCSKVTQAEADSSCSD